MKGGISNLIAFSLSFLIVLSSCNPALNIKSTVNVPIISEERKHEVTLTGSLQFVELQHNHLVGKRWILQHGVSHSFNFDLGDGIRTEMGLGKLSSNPFIAGVGFSRVQGNVAISGLYDGDVFTIKAPGLYHLYFQKTIGFGMYERTQGKLQFTYKSDVMYAPFVSIESQERRNDLFHLNEFNLMWYSQKPLRLQLSMGAKVGYSPTAANLDWPSWHRVQNEWLYARIGFRF